MKFKRRLVTTILGLSVFCVSTGASAEGNKNNLVDSDVTQSVKQATNTSQFNTLATPTNTSNTDVYSPWTGGAYAVSKSSSTVSEDYIYAKCRTFNQDGSLLNSKTSNEENSSYVSAKAANGSAWLKGDWAIGNHKYQLSGYQDVIHETKAYW